MAKLSHLLAWATQRNTAKISLSRGACCLATCSSHSILLIKIADMLLGSDKSAGMGMLRTEEGVHCFSISFNRGRIEYFNSFVIDAIAHT